MTWQPAHASGYSIPFGPREQEPEKGRYYWTAWGPHGVETGFAATEAEAHRLGRQQAEWLSKPRVVAPDAVAKP
jgi:hypothetical protein